MTNPVDPNFTSVDGQILASFKKQWLGWFF
jgi:hypothetical protein